MEMRARSEGITGEKIKDSQPPKIEDNSSTNTSTNNKTSAYA